MASTVYEMEICEGDDLVGQSFSLFLCPHPGAFAHFFKKMITPGGWPGGGGGGMGTALTSPGMLLSFATCTCSAQFFDARNNIA